MCAKNHKHQNPSFESIGYPTRNGIAISVNEIWLPKSELDLGKKGNFNNHHNSWTERMFGRCILFNTLRDLESQQFALPLDIHDYLHLEFDPPKMPTIQQAIAEIERAKDAGERLHVLKKVGETKHKKKEYIYEELGDTVMKRVILSYNELKRRELA